MMIQAYTKIANFHMRRSNPPESLQLPNPYSLLPRLFKINQVRLIDNSATVEVTVYQLRLK